MHRRNTSAGSFHHGGFRERPLRRIDVRASQPDWRRVQRGLDLLLAAALLLLTLPLLLLTALAITCDSRGPVLQREPRLGPHGRVFALCRFRSTHADARGPVWAVQRPPRLTRVGALIRLTRIDELPQLLNVLRGELSFIGPHLQPPPS